MKDLELIKNLMDQLQEAMGLDGDDLHERLGKSPIDLTIEGSVSGDEDVDPDMDHDFDESEGMFQPKSEGMDLKKRLMSIRGK